MGVPEVLERVTTPRGELVLRRVGDHLEVISNGVFLMDTRDGRSERALVREALTLHGAARRLLVGGLGVGFSLLEAVADPRVEVAVQDVAAHLATHPGGYDVVCLDVDNGPDWTVTEANAGLYGEDGLRRCLDALRPGGVLAVWSAQPAPAYEAVLRGRLDDVRAVEIPSYVERGAPDVVYLGRRRG